MKNFKIEFKWAIIFSIFTLLWMYFEKSMGWHSEAIFKHQVYTNLIIIPLLFILIISLELSQKKVKYYKGIMTWEQGLISGSITSIIICIFSPILQYFFSEIISPEYYKIAAEHLSAQGRTSIEEAHEVYSLTASIIDAIVFNLAMGIITSAVVSLFLKTIPKKD